MSQRNIDDDHELALADRRYERVKRQRDEAREQLGTATGLLRELDLAVVALTDDMPDSATAGTALFVALADKLGRARAFLATLESEGK